MTGNLAIGPFVLAGSPRRLRFGEAPVDLEDSALDVLTAIARSPGGVAAAELWPLVSSDAAVDEERLSEFVGRINAALGRWTPAWYVAWYPDDARVVWESQTG